MAEVQRTHPDPELEALQAEWAPAWKIWRARRRDGKPGELVASRMDDDAGPDRTVMRATTQEMDAALRLQSRSAGCGYVPLGLGYASTSGPEE